MELNAQLGSVADDFIKKCIVFEMEEEHGIAGMFATHLLIEDNLISGTGWQKMELSWEAGGIKLEL